MSASGPFDPPGAGPAAPNPYAPPSSSADAPAPYPPAAPYPPGPPVRSGGDYELDAEENRVVSAAALAARVLGGVLILQGVVSLAQVNVIGAALNIAIGAMLVSAGGSFSAVVHTEGDDIGNLMAAMSKLGTVFKIRVILTLVVMVFVLIALVCGVMVGVMRH